jgi:1-acyl-sn-glycerol-3-phosphate acyltransferase
MVYRFAQFLVRSLRPLLGPLNVQGLHHVPDQGPFLLLANHQSYLDPILIQAIVSRPVCTMSKSTQFSNRITGPILKALKGFPVRRFEVDPQAVRLALRYLQQGDGVGIYIEGERSWDGRLQPLRRGTVRLVLNAGVPVIPCGISGAYDAWPRWDRRLKRAAIQIRFGEPMRFPLCRDRTSREAHLDEAYERISATLAELAGVERGPES